MNQKIPTPEEQRRLVLAVFLSMLVIIGYYAFLKPQPKTSETANLQELIASQPKSAKLPPGVKPIPHKEIKYNKPSPVFRYNLENSKLSGSVLNGGSKIDDIKLINYKESLGSDENVTLLKPFDKDSGYSIEVGWLTSNKDVIVPGVHSRWKEKGLKGNLKRTIQPGRVSIFSAENNDVGIKRTFSLDDEYKITIIDEVYNKSDKDITLYPFSKIVRKNHPKTGRRVVHEGPVGYINEELFELDYDDLEDDDSNKALSKKGWIGLSDKYWLTAIIPEQEEDKVFRFNSVKISENDIRYQMDVRGKEIVLQPGKATFVKTHFFIGAKELNVLNRYEKELGVEHFDLAIDFGWYYFITKPFSMFLSKIGGYLEANGFEMAFGLALLIFTIIIRGATFPLANKSFRSMNAMKKLQPRMKEIKEKFGSNPPEMQKALLELYQTEKVTPFSGCWPMFVQIPIFFALYKTLYISLDMRHAPFWGWVNDLSAPDPTSVLNLFGLIPVDLPDAMVIGIWPILYGVTMTMQKRLNPAPMDKMQNMMMSWMPWVFTYMFSQLPAGMVIYFVWSNILGMSQQYWLQHKMGLEPSFFNRKTAEEYKDKVMTSDKIKTVRDWSNVQDAVEVKDDKPPSPKTKSPKKKSKKKKK